MKKMLKFVNGTVFPNLNHSKGLDAAHVTKEISLNELKYKHLREMQTIKPEQHMSYMMMVLTGLTEQDLDELSSDDAAELIGIVHNVLEKHIKLGKNFLNLMGITEDKAHLLRDSLNEYIA